MKYILAVLVAGLAGGVSADSAPDLPNCTGDYDVSWNNCVGTRTWAKGNKYVGEFKDGKFNGQGTLITPTGSKYVSEFKNGLVDGQGAFTSPAGGKYVGGYKDGKSHGQGTFTSPMGNRYVGEYKNGKRNGQGTSTSPNGDKYVGQWKDNERNGQGTLTYADGSTKEGIWNDDEFLGTVAEVEAAKKAAIADAEQSRAELEKAERIYNACLVDKGAEVDMTVSSLESAVKATCRSIAEDPSFLDGLRYD